MITVIGLALLGGALVGLGVVRDSGDIVIGGVIALGFTALRAVTWARKKDDR